MIKILLKILGFLLMFILVTSFLEGTYSHGSGSSDIDENFMISTVKSMKAPTGWSDDIRLTFSGKEESPKIAVSGNFVHVVWDNLTFPYGVYYRRSLDKGKSWEPEKMLIGPEASGSSCPRIAVNGSNVHVVQAHSGEVYYVNGINNGEIWGMPIAISTGDGSDDMHPDIAVNGDNVHIVWDHEKGTTEQYELCYRNSTDGGKTWNPIQTIENDGATQGDAHIAVNGSNVHVVWGAWTPGWETYYKKSGDGGITWSTKVPISKIDGYDSDLARIAVNCSNIHVVWRDNMDYSADETHYRNSGDNGDNWNEEVNITPNDGNDSQGASIAVCGSNVHIVWADRRDYVPELGAAIYYRNSPDNGASWNDEMRLTFTPYPGGSGAGNIAVSGSNIHVVFSDIKDIGTGDWDIYYKRSPKFNAPPEINDLYPQTNVTITETQTQLFSVNASDLDNDNLTYQWYLNDNPLVNETNLSYLFIPGENFSGNYSVKVSVSDGKDFANHTWIVTVINVGQLQQIITDLQNQLYQAMANYTTFQAIISQLSDNLSSLWTQLNESLINNTELENDIILLIQNLTNIWNELNQSLSNNTNLQLYINQLNNTLNLSAAQISAIWAQLNQSSLNETSLLNQLSSLNENITNLQEEIVQLKKEKEQAESEREQSARESWVIIGILLVMVVAAWVSAGLVRRKKVY